MNKILNNMEIKKVDKQGRIVLPADWRKKSMEGDEVLVIMSKDGIRILPRKDRKLSSFYEKAHRSDLGIDPFEDYEESLRRASR